MVFKSAVDTWFLLLMGGVGIVVLYATFSQWTILPTSGRVVMIVTLAVSVGLPVWLLLHTHYTVADDTLTVRSGPFRWRIDVADIERIEPSKSMLSSPALSLDRIAVRYGNSRTILLSPADRQGFASALDLTLEEPQ